MRRLALILALSALALPGCGGSSPTAPTVTGQLVVTDVVVGAGAVAANGDTLNVTYTLTLADGTLIGQADQPFSFVLGTGAVIAGWDQGLVGMRVGGERKLVVPPNLGYGPQANGPIPGNSTLYFDIHLLSLTSP